MLTICYKFHMLYKAMCTLKKIFRGLIIINEHNMQINKDVEF